MSGKILGVNPFNQPGVEKYKTNMFKLLGKPGYEKNIVSSSDTVSRTEAGDISEKNAKKTTSKSEEKEKVSTIKPKSKRGRKKKTE